MRWSVSFCARAPTPMRRTRAATRRSICSRCATRPPPRAATTSPEAQARSQPPHAETRCCRAHARAHTRTHTHAYTHAHTHAHAHSQTETQHAHTRVRSIFAARLSSLASRLSCLLSLPSSRISPSDPPPLLLPRLPTLTFARVALFFRLYFLAAEAQRFLQHDMFVQLATVSTTVRTLGHQLCYVL
eukprot:5337769-Pleurochrysis_carterae.AAC.1